MTQWPSEIDFTRHLLSGDTVTWSHAGAEPVTLITQLLGQRHRIGGPFCVFMTGVSFTDLLRGEHTDVIRFKSIGGLSVPRAFARAGHLEVIPRRYGDIPDLIRSGRFPIDVQLLTVSPPDEDGFVSLGVTVGTSNDVLSQARCVIAEINPHMPRVAGDTRLHIDRLAGAIWSDRPLVTSPPMAGEPSAAAIELCRHIAARIPDEATVQIGIGSIGVVLPRLLRERRDLGIHSAILTDGLMDLMQQGAATGRRKGTDPGIAVAGELIGSDRLYRFADRNPSLQLRDSRYLLAPSVIEQSNRLVSVNSCIEVDLSGQVNAETLAGVNVGAIGGQVDFVRGASRAPEGLSIIALQSLANNGSSRIVARLADGIVTTARSEVGLIVTEYGIADLRAKTDRERAEALIAIAHPSHRDALRASSLRQPSQKGEP